MNALSVEEAFKLAAAAIYDPLTAYCGTNGDLVPNEDPIVVFLCESCEHKGGPYWTAALSIEVDAPALTGDALVPYSAVWQALLDWLEDKDAVAAAFPAGGIDLNGFFVRTSGQGIRDNRWIASIALTVGVARAA